MNGSVVMKNRPRIPTPDVTKEVVDRENRLAQMHLNNNHPGSQNSSTGSISPNSLANALVAHNPVPYSDQMPVAVQVMSFVLRYFSNLSSRKCSCSSVTWRVSKLLFIEFHIKTKNIELGTWYIIELLHSKRTFLALSICHYLCKNTAALTVLSDKTRTFF